MAQITLKLFVFAILHIFTFALANPSPKGGKGGSDSDGSSSGNDSGNSGSSSSSSAPKGKQHVEISGDKWPYRWAGSYYNGSIVRIQLLAVHFVSC
jgi:hypothetical protein